MRLKNNIKDILYFACKWDFGNYINRKLKLSIIARSFLNKLEKLTTSADKLLICPLDKIDKTIPLPLVATISVICLSTIIALLSYSFFSNFCILDEGHHFYLNQNGSLAKSGLITYQIISNALGSLFNHKLIYYRFCNLSLFLIMSAYCTLAIKKFFFKEIKFGKASLITLYSFITISSFTIFTWYSSLNYYNLTIISTMGWLSSLLLYASISSSKEYKLKYTYLFLLAFFTITTIISKFSFGIPLVFASLFTLLLWHKKICMRPFIEISLFCTFLIIILGTFYSLNIEYWNNFFLVFKDYFMPKENLENINGRAGALYLIKRYYSDIYTFLMGRDVERILSQMLYIYFIPASVLITYNKNLRLWLILRIYIVLYICYIALASLPSFITTHDEIIRNRPEGSNFILLIAYTISSLFYLIKYRSDKKIVSFIFCFIVCGICITNPFGTDLNFVRIAAISNIFVFIPFISFVCFETEVFKKNKIFVLAIMISLSLIVGISTFRAQFLYYYRTHLYLKQDTYSKYSPYLTGIKVEKELADNIDNIITSLKENNFDYEHDRIFDYEDLVGYLAAIGAKSFGQPWNITYKPVHDLYNDKYQRTCYFIELENTKNINNIWILKTNKAESNEALNSCFFNKLTKQNNFKEIYIGNMLHAWHGNINIYLEGPYKFSN